MSDRYDILIVGGRCAGSAAAIALGKAGYRILMVERRKMPSDTISTHVMWPDGVAALDDLGVLDRVMDAGAATVRHFRMRRGEDEVFTSLLPYRGYDHFLSLRRERLDGILWDAAAGVQGVEVADRTRLDRLTFEGDRVTGGVLVSGGEERTVQAELVIGADGRDSTVAAQVGAVEDDVVDPGRYWYYSYFKDVRETGPIAMTQSDQETNTVVGMATDSGLYMVINGSYVEDYDEFRADYRNNYLKRVMGHSFFAELLADATHAAPVYGITGIRGYYRTPYGPGWLLMGDAVHQKNPLVARGINDAYIAGLDLGDLLKDGITPEGLEQYARLVRERTATTARTSRMLLRPDQHLSADQAEVLFAETSTPEGMSRVLGLEYGDVVSFDDMFMTGRDSVVELPAER